VKRRKTDYIVIHCAATPASMDIGAKEIREWHKKRGWRDIGYHYVIRRNGQTEFGRPEDVQGAHAVGYNMVSIGICLVGGVADDKKTAVANFTDAQWESLGHLIEELRARYPRAKVVGHRDLDKKKECPSFDVALWLQMY
jgi:N-acetylmuramoyl-L-alanine amidase